MSVRLLERGLGAVLECNVCDGTLATGQILKTSIRTYAKSVGWIRGLWTPGTKLFPSNLKNDICPACAVAERARVAQRNKEADERRAVRNAKRKARDEAMKKGAA